MADDAQGGAFARGDHERPKIQLAPLKGLPVVALEPANIAAVHEMNKPVPNGARIEKLMRWFMYTAGVTGILHIATLIIMFRVGSR